MSIYFPYLLFGLFLYLASYFFYVSVSHGLGHKAEYLQLRRFIPCAVLAVLPIALAHIALTSPFLKFQTFGNLIFLLHGLLI